jgi:NIMA (never in mitosis gene a)-related kinase
VSAPASPANRRRRHPGEPFDLLGTSLVDARRLSRSSSNTSTPANSPRLARAAVRLSGVPVDTTGDGVLDSVAVDTTQDGLLDAVVPRAGGVLVDTTGDGRVDSVAIDSAGSGRVDMIVSIEDFGGGGGCRPTGGTGGSSSSSMTSGVGSGCYGSPLATSARRQQGGANPGLSPGPAVASFFSAEAVADDALPDIFQSLHAVHKYRAYQRVRVLGRGTNGMAVLLRSAETGEMLVSKQLPAVGMTPAELEQVRNEVLLLKRLSHAHIIAFHDVVQRGSELCLCLEYAAGGTLAQRIEKQRRSGAAESFTATAVVTWTLQLAQAVAYMHKHRVLHRDLSTKNVFLSASSEIKVGDFGVSKLMALPESLATTMCGTPYYLSAELARGEPYGAPSDVWSVGVILFELLTLRRPFNAERLPALLRQIAAGEYAADALQRSPHSAELRWLVTPEALLHPDPAVRRRRRLEPEHLPPACSDAPCRHTAASAHAGRAAPPPSRAACVGLRLVLLRALGAARTTAGRRRRRRRRAARARTASECTAQECASAPTRAERSLTTDVSTSEIFKRQQLCSLDGTTPHTKLNNTKVKEAHTQRPPCLCVVPSSHRRVIRCVRPIRPCHAHHTRLRAGFGTAQQPLLRKLKPRQPLVLPPPPEESRRRGDECRRAHANQDVRRGGRAPGRGLPSRSKRGRRQRIGRLRRHWWWRWRRRRWRLRWWRRRRRRRWRLRWWRRRRQRRRRRRRRWRR